MIFDAAANGSRFHGRPDTPARLQRRLRLRFSREHGAMRASRGHVFSFPRPPGRVLLGTLARRDDDDDDDDPPSANT
jgi:hypothetical protein